MTACEWCGGEEAAGVCPRSLACPQCAAVAGSSCRRPSGHRAAALHAGRIRAAEELDRLELEAPGLDEHAGGQLRISAQGDQLSMVPLEDEAIPSQPVDTEAARELERRRARDVRYIRPTSVELVTIGGTTFYGSPDCLYTPSERGTT